MSKSKTYVEFFPFYEKFIPIIKEHHKNVNTGNKRFNELMHAYIDLNIEHEALTLIFTPRMKHPTEEEMAPFYKDFMIGANFKSAIILDVPKGLHTLGQHQLFKYLRTDAKNDLKDKSESSYKTVETIENDTLRGYFAAKELKKFKAYDNAYLNFSKPFRKDIALSDYTLKQVEDFELTIKSMDAGGQGFDFTYKDINGKDVSFSDFRGKYVYIDAWATWCSPCKQQIPYLQQLEKELHDKNIVFVSISMDKPKSKEKWEKFVKEKELPGVQLISENAFDTRIAKDYKINSIPRFFLFDPEGKIIDANAKSPMEPALRKQLLQLLK